jgi:hypothetical protein
MRSMLKMQIMLVFEKSMINLLLNPLNLIVPVREPIICCFIHDLSHVLCSLNLTHLQDKPTSQVLYRLRQKTWQTRMIHLFNNVNYVLRVPSRYQEPFDHQVQVKLKWFRFQTASHDFNHFLSQLEIGFFEL